MKNIGKQFFEIQRKMRQKKHKLNNRKINWKSLFNTINEIIWDARSLFASVWKAQ